MATRKEVFEMRHPERMVYLRRGVMFINFPANHQEGHVLYDSGMLDVAEQITKKIPKDLREAVIVDFNKIDAWGRREKILEKRHGGPLPQEHIVGEAERELMEMLGWSYDADTETFHPEEESLTEST